MTADRKIHIRKAPPHVQAIATFAEQAANRGMQVNHVETFSDGSGILTATNDATIVTGQLNPNGRMIIRQTTR